MLKLGLGRKRAPFYIPRNPVINWNSPQADGLVFAVIHNYGGVIDGGILAQKTVNQSCYDLVGGRWPDELDDDSGNYMRIWNHYEAGPMMGHPDVGGHGSSRSFFYANANNYETEVFSLSIWSVIENTDISTHIGIGIGDNLNEYASVSETGGIPSFKGLFKGSLASQTSGTNTIDYVNLYHYVVTITQDGVYDEMDTYQNGVDQGFSDPIDAATYGTIPSSPARYIFRQYVDAMTLEARIYNRRLMPDEIWQMYSPETRWDLYKGYDLAEAPEGLAALEINISKSGDYIQIVNP